MFASNPVADSRLLFRISVVSVRTGILRDTLPKTFRGGQREQNLARHNHVDGLCLAARSNAGHEDASCRGGAAQSHNSWLRIWAAGESSTFWSQHSRGNIDGRQTSFRLRPRLRAAVDG